MTCRVLADGKGVTIIACSRGVKKSCSTPGCRNYAQVLCDFFIMSKGEVATCDRPVCSRCAKHTEEGKDYCRAHAKIVIP